MDCVVNTAFNIDVALFVCHRVCHKDNVHVATFLAQIGDSGDVFIADIAFKEHQEVFVGNVWRTYLGSFFIYISHSDQLSRYVFQTFLCLQVIT